ncbi:MAG: hypothetical protein ACHQUC_08885 [Chlamydiales bacterium]
MKETNAKPFDHFIHPYVFVLKEGRQIHRNFLDYSLLLLQVGQADTLRSPIHYQSQKTSSPAVQLLKKY